MTTIDYQFLDKLGLSELPSEEKDKKIAEITSELSQRSHNRTEQHLSDAQLNELDELSKMSTPLAVDMWLQSNWPGYQAVYEEEVQNIMERLSGPWA